MKKTLKYVLLSLSILLLLLVFSAICLVTFVNPNRFKPLLTQQVMKYTGRQLSLDGDLSWTVFPYLGIKTGHAVLSNPEGFSQKNFVEIDQVTVGVSLLPLLHKKIESSGIQLRGMKLNLIKNAEGKTNWNFQSSSVPASPASADPSISVKKASISLVISGVDIVDAEVNWLNEQTHQAFKIENLTLHADHIDMVSPFSLAISFHFSAKNPAVSGQISLTSHTSLNLEKQVYSFRDLDVAAKIKQAQQNFDMKITGNVIADLTQHVLQWTDLKAVVSNLILRGKINIGDLETAPRITGHFQIESFDLKEWLKNMGQDISHIQVLKNVSGVLDLSSASHVMSGQGKLNLEQVQVNQVRMKDVIVPIHFQDGVIELSPITANFYEGSLQSQVKVDVNGETPRLALQGKLARIQAGPLLQDLGGASQKLKFTGLGNMNFQVTTAGNDSNTIIKNLNGTGQLKVEQGELQGIDVPYLINAAYSLAKQRSLISGDSNTNKTDFGTLTGTISIRNGVLSNEDLLMDSSHFTAKGKGEVDLVNQHINYQLQTFVKQISSSDRDNIANLYGLPIPILVSGNLKSPSVSLDTQTLLKALAEKQIKKAATKVQERIKDEIKNRVPGNAGELLNNLLGQ